MKQGIISFLGAALFLAVGNFPANAQAANTPANPFRAQFQLAWDYVLSDIGPVKLLDIGPATEEKRMNLAMLIAGKDRNDYKRKLIVAHWDGFRFATDYTTEFLGTHPDALLIAPLRAPKAVPASAPAPPKKPSKAATHQVVTTEGVYEWMGKSFTRLFAAPTHLRLAIMCDKQPARLLAGATEPDTYEVGDSAVTKLETFAPPIGNNCYARSGVGLQEFPGSAATEIVSGVRYAQTFWSNRDKWFVCVARGKPMETTNDPEGTVGDRLSLYMPKFDSRDKSFWATGKEDMEEAWRSDPLPGHILDVRVGDPKNEGKDGILVLTSENEGKIRHLYFFLPARGLPIRR